MPRPPATPEIPEEPLPGAVEMPEETDQDTRLPPRETLGSRGTWAGRWHTLSRLPVTLMIASVLLGLGIVQLSFQLGNTIYRSVTWKQETQQTAGRVKTLQRDVNILRDAEKSASDPAYLEELARCQGFVGRGESVIVAQNAPTTPTENCQAVRLP